MTLMIREEEFRKVAVIDDNEIVRESYSEELVDLGLEPVSIDGPIDNFDNLWKTLEGCDAVVTDLMLKSSGYANFNGGFLAGECRKREVPTILCTSYYSDINRQLPRSERRQISAILSQTQFSYDKIKAGFETAVDEIKGIFTPERRPWRTQVEIVDYDEEEKYMYVIVMGRSLSEKVGMYIEELPQKNHQQVKKGRILHAIVNTGAHNADDLFFDEWEF